MKRTYHPPILLALLFIGAFALVACVRPIPGSPTPTTAAPVTNPTLPVATLPVATLPGTLPTPTTGVVPPAGGDATQPPGATPAVDPAATATIALPTATPDIALTPQIQPPVTGGEQTYVVQRGDNLFRIGLRYNCHFSVLARYNGIPDPARINVGQVIRIPATC